MAEHEPDVMVEIVYYTPARFGERMGVSLHDALTNHPDARIVSFANGQSFDTPEGDAALKATKARIREERAAERAAAEPKKPKVKPGPDDAPAPEPVVVVIAAKPDSD